jgi:hypothetical protein
MLSDTAKIRKAIPETGIEPAPSLRILAVRCVDDVGEDRPVVLALECPGQ